MSKGTRRRLGRTDTGRGISERRFSHSNNKASSRVESRADYARSVVTLRPPLILAGGMSMNKTLCAVALLMGTLALTGSQSAAVPAAPTSPPIIARVKLANQTAAIPTTTIFTPAQTGLYRISLYLTQTIAVPNNND